MNIRLVAAILLAIFSTPIFSVHAAPGDEHWARTFGAPGPTNNVFAMAVRGERVYASGFFSAGPISSNNWIETWDGLTWSALPGVFTGSMPIYSAALVGPDLYVCGFFSQIDGAPADGIARWNGSSWDAIGDVRGISLVLDTDGTNLYMGGIFTNIGGVNVTNVAKWDGRQWSSVGDSLGVDGTANTASYVSALHWDGTALYAGGRFTNSGAQSVSYMARWNGAAWESVGGGVDGPVFAIASGSGSVYAGGDFVTAGGIPAQAIARWDGKSWSPLGAGLIGYVSGPVVFRGPVFALGVLGTNVIAGGSFTNAGGLRATRIARWNGSAWAAMGAMNDAVQQIRVSGTNAYIGGGFTQADDVYVNHLATWNPEVGFRSLGGARRAEGIPFPGARSLAAASDGRIYAGGQFTGVGRIKASRVACWDGTNWSALGSGVLGTNTGSGTSVNALAIDSAGAVYAGGTFTNAGGVRALNIARWNGSSWSALGSGVPGNVSAIAARGSDIFVGGTFTMSLPGGQFAFNIAKWDGTQWSSLPGAAFFGTIGNFTVSALAVSGSDIYVGGNFVAGGFSGETSTHIAMHNGSDWVALGAGVNSNVTAIAVVGADVFVGGRFSRAGAVNASRIARWNGSAWSDVGGGVAGTGSFQVSALAAIGSDVYAAGTFTNAGGIIASRIARWNGAEWSPLGSGMARSFATPSVLALASSGADLFATGNFEGAGNKPASYIAQWNATRNFDILPTISFSSPTLLPGGRFLFQADASQIDSYLIEFSSNLTNWFPLQTNSGGSASMEDTIAEPHRFFRARSLP